MILQRDIPLAKDKSIVAEVPWSVEDNMDFPGTSSESNRTWQLQYTPKLFNNKPFAPPSSNCADVWW